MDFGTGIALLVAFLAVVVLIIRGQSPIIMLLILAVLWSAMAPGPADRLAESTVARLDELDRRLEPAKGWSLRRILAFL